MAEKQTESGVARTEPGQGRLAKRQYPGGWRGPFSMMQRFAEEVDRIFEESLFGRESIAPRAMGSWLGPAWSRGDFDTWSPQVEMFQRGNELVIKADVPGLAKEDVKVDVQEDAITIQGERRREHEEEREGIYRSERSYGSFYRTIPLPPGAIADQAKARFKNGVLEIVMPAPPEQVTRGRRLEIAEDAKS